ncbi:DUF262 domain-containing HNH endonuclease family protein (plasmid) [Deinococcus radiomollis]|uniref:DUF262 domain-containing protein n=1 Tax=Deinococcus radiomollis TaxID=468916 RepID=UPI003892BA0A
MAPNTMDTSILDLYSLFHSDRRYIVPLYQRRYVWSQERQWVPLWQDIIGRADAVLAGGDVRPHFLGTVVLAPFKTSTRDVRANEVIDGQQRLTTLQLFLAAARDLTREIDPDLNKAFNKLTDNDCTQKHQEQRFKVWPTLFDQPGFEHVLLANSAEAVRHWVDGLRIDFQHVPQVALAYLYFSKELNTWLMNGPQTPAARLDALFETLNHHLQLVVIDLGDQDDPQMIFETLNARGEPLQASDLVRNHIFSQAAQAFPVTEVKRLHETYWTAFDQDGGFWREKKSRGRVAREQLSWFLQYLLTFKIGEEIADTQLFGAFKRWWNASYSGAQVEAGLIELRRLGEVYRRIESPDASSQLGILARRLEAVDTSSLHPLLLFLLTDATITPGELGGCLTDLESFVMRRFITNLGPKNYNRLFLTLIQQLQQQDVVTRQAVAAFLLSGEGESVRWPTDTELQHAFLYEPVYRQLRTRGVMTVLEAIDLQLTTGKQEQLLLKQAVSVEHVLPQRWQTHWPAPLARDGVDHPDAWRDRLLHTFGNLTLLTIKLNIDVSNGAYAVKRPQIAEQSALRLNTFFQKQFSWDEDVISERSQTLCDVALQIWPWPAMTSTRTSAAPIGLSTFVTSEATVRAASTLLSVPADSRVILSTDGFQVRLRHWPKQVSYAVRTREDEDLIEVALDVALPAADARRPSFTAALLDVTPVVELDFSEQEVRARSDTGTLGLNIFFPAQTSAERLEQALSHLMTLTSERIYQALGTPSTPPKTASERPARPALEAAVTATRAVLPTTLMFAEEDNLKNRDYRRVFHVDWPIQMHYELTDSKSGVTVALHDELDRQHPRRPMTLPALIEIQELVETTFPGVPLRSTLRDPKKAYMSINLEFPHGTAPDVLAAALLRLVELSATSITEALGQEPGPVESSTPPEDPNVQSRVSRRVAGAC